MLTWVNTHIHFNTNMQLLLILFQIQPLPEGPGCTVSELVAHSKHRWRVHIAGAVFGICWWLFREGIDHSKAFATTHHRPVQRHITDLCNDISQTCATNSWCAVTHTSLINLINCSQIEAYCIKTCRCQHVTKRHVTGWWHSASYTSLYAIIVTQQRTIWPGNIWETLLLHSRGVTTTTLYTTDWIHSLLTMLPNSKLTLHILIVYL